jgi:hypothetical protein
MTARRGWNASGTDMVRIIRLPWTTGVARELL